MESRGGPVDACGDGDSRRRSKRRLTWPAPPPGALACEPADLIEAWDEADLQLMVEDELRLVPARCSDAHEQMPLGGPAASSPGARRAVMLPAPADVLLRSPTYESTLLQPTLTGSHHQQPQQSGPATRVLMLHLSDESSAAGPPLPQGPDTNCGTHTYALLAASSCSRRSCWGVALGGDGCLAQAQRACSAAPHLLQQQHQPPHALQQALLLDEGTPPAAAVMRLPAAPRKVTTVNARGHGVVPPRAARALAGLAPTGPAQLSQARAWLSALEAQ